MKIGILSFAHLHAESYISHLQRMQGIQLMGLADEDPGRGAPAADRYGTKLYPSYEALLDDRPDGVIICSENTKHAGLSELAASAGVGILCEKPLATTLEDAQRMLDACHREKVLLMTAFPMRFSVPLMEVKSRLGALGRIYCCSTTNQGQLPRHHRDWFVDKKLAGGGALMDHVVHLTDVLRWYLECEVVEVYAQSNRILHGNTVEVETGGLLMLTFQDGTFASIDCSWSRPYHFPTWGGVSLHLVGEKGVLEVDAFKQEFTIYGKPEKHTRSAFWGTDADELMIQEFIGALREERPPGITGYDGYKALEVVIAAYASAESGKPVSLPLIRPGSPLTARPKA